MGWGETYDAKVALKARLMRFANDRHEPAGSGKGGRFAPKDESDDSDQSDTQAEGLGRLLQPAIDAIAEHNAAAQVIQDKAAADAANANKAASDKYTADHASWQGRKDASAASYTAASKAWGDRKTAWDASQGAATEQAIVRQFQPQQAQLNQFDNLSIQWNAQLGIMEGAAGTPAWDAAYGKMNAIEAQMNGIATALGKANPQCAAGLTSPGNGIGAVITSAFNSCINSQIQAYRDAHPAAPFTEPSPTNGFNEPEPQPPAGVAPIAPTSKIGGVAANLEASFGAISDSAKTSVNHALDVISSVHGLDPTAGRKVDISSTDYLGDGVKGQYNGSLNTIQVLNTDTAGQFAFTHEFGHYLESQQLTSPEQQAAISKLDNIWATTPTIQRISKVAQDPTDLNFGWAKYALNPKEEWARSYSQWVATKSTDPEIKKELAENRTGLGQWSDDEFKPISDQLDQIFGVKGLRS